MLFKLFKLDVEFKFYWLRRLLTLTWSVKNSLSTFNDDDEGYILFIVWLNTVLEL